jgi:hypothetical protein
MERQEKYRKKQQQANEAAIFGSTGSGGKHSHEALNTQVWLHCQNEVISGTVNFLTRVASNLGKWLEWPKNGGQTRSWIDCQRYSEPA